jgi:hypothetical protein
VRQKSRMTRLQEILRFTKIEFDNGVHVQRALAESTSFAAALRKMTNNSDY